MSTGFEFTRPSSRERPYARYNYFRDGCGIYAGSSRVAASTATYKATGGPEMELLLQHSSRPEKSPARHATMASSCSTTLLASSLPMKIVPYVPGVAKPKPRPKSKAKSMATTKTAEQNRSGVSSSNDGGEWFHIDDDFLMLDSNASLPTLYETADASNSVDHVDAVGGFRTASEFEKPEHYQFGGELLDQGGTNHATCVAEAGLDVIGLLSGSSRERPFIVESDAAERNHSATRVKPSNGGCQENGYHTDAGNEKCVAAQQGDLKADEVRAFSVEDIESIRPDSLLAQNEPLFGDVDVTDEPSATRKRTRSAALDVMPEPELEDPRSAKRRRPVKRQAENLILDPVPMPKSTPLPTPSSSVSHSRAGTEPSLGTLNIDSKRDGAGTPRPSPSDLHDEEDGGDRAHSRRTGEELLHSLRGPISASGEIAGEQEFGLDLGRRWGNLPGEDGESHEGEPDQDGESSRPLAKRRKRRNPPLSEKRYSLLQNALRPSTMSTSPLRQISASQPQQLFQTRIDKGPRFCSPRTSSSGTKPGDYGPNLDMSYTITDLTLCAVPDGSSIVTAIVRHHDSRCSLDLAALGHEFFGQEGKVMRMTQLSPDSWMLLGYRYEDSAEGPCTLGRSKADWMMGSQSDVANHETDQSDDDDWDEEDEEGEEGTEQRTRKWSGSDKERLLSFKDKQGMKWTDICKRFPDRTPGAVKVRYYMLHKKGL
ncbi:hypothetical protein BCR34DRAFT_605748 [Clohesyomyces aquaticus]|uniref:Myb-like domain-containing protein n=1 Tax=Clohesyomyces aquaticus TaxID=1231657 RepID=A0A1Y1YV86_9PLEO|nr:hypothetical protein BCR34DRAFT_605748 [Clohesyomyces aquaticus]